MHVRAERSRRSTIAAAMAIIATSFMVSVVGGRLATSNGGPPPLTVNTSPAHPGMMYVEWHQPEARALKLQWSSDGTNVSEAVLVPSQGTSRNGIIIPNLTAGTYRVTTSVVTWQDQTWHATQSAQATVAQSADPAACPQHPRNVPNGQGGWITTFVPATICGTLTGLPQQGRNSMQVYSDSASSGLAISDTSFTWAPPSDLWPRTTWGAEQFFGVSPYMRARIQYLDMSGQAVSQWWSAFGESGARFDTATDVLVPMDPARGGVRLNFDLTRITNVVTFSGEFSKVSGSGSAPVVAADFERLCVQVFDTSVGQTTPQLVYSQVMCANKGNPSFYDDAHPGRWRITLPAGNYRLRFQDEANYASADGTLIANVTFAPEWCCGTGGSRAERSTQATVLSTTTTALNATLRPAKQLQVTVSGVPANYATSGTQANIVVGDDFGNWTGGAMATSSANSWTALVTGLVEGRAYKIFLSFSGSNGAPDRWWLVGGGTLDGAEGIVPGDQLTEPWQPAPYLVTLHHTDGTPLGNNQGCVAVFPLGSSTQVASNCTNGQGEIPLQRLMAGRYRVIAWTADGQSTLEVGEFEVSATQTMSTRPDRGDHAVGIANLNALANGASLEAGYQALGAVVMPGTSPPPSPPFLVTLHQNSGAPITNGGACLEMQPVSGGSVTGPQCTDGSGIVVIGPVAPGPHTVRVRTGGTVAFTYTYDVPTRPNTFDWGSTTYAIGLANSSNLPQQVSLPDGYPDWLAVVLP